MAYESVYPLAQSDDYVKATTKISVSYWPYFATDPTKSLTGASSGNAFLAASEANQRFHIDLGTAKTVKRIYYENYHTSGASTTNGAKTFIFQGSNNAAAFAELTYGTDTNWTTITTAAGQFDQHTGSDVVDPKYITVTNTTAYRYYAIKIAISWDGVQYIGFRRVELQIVPVSGGILNWFFSEAWRKHDRLWRPKLILPKDLGYQI